MIEYTVKYDFYPLLLRGFYKCDKCFFTAKDRIDCHIICRVVFMVGCGSENRAEIYSSCAERLDVIKLFNNTPKSAAVEYIVI